MPRRRLNPTDEQRRLVKTMAAIGIAQEEIARVIGVRSPKTLRKHFRDELDRGATEANVAVGQALFKNARDGDTTAQIFWLKSRAHWRDRSGFEPGSAQPAPFIVSVEQPQL